MEVVIRLPKPYDLQKEILKDKTRFKVLCLGRRSGKTTLLSIHIILSMLKNKRVCLITPEYGLGEKLFLDILNYIPEEAFKSKNKAKLNCELLTGGTLNVFSGEALHRVRGFEFDELCIDEAAWISDLENEWNLSLRPLLLKTRGNVIFTSTPRGKNFFYSLFQKGVNGDEGFKSWKFSTHFNPYIPKEELEELISTMPEANYRQEILAEPGEDITNPFGSENIEKCTIENLSSRATVCYGVDFARVNDYTVIVGQDAYGHMTYYERFKSSFEDTINRIKKLREKDPYTMIVCDSTGIGSVLLERLQNEVYNVIGFTFTGVSKPMIMHDLIKDVESGNIGFNKETATEMNTFQFKYTSNGNVKYEAASGFHDDIICALAVSNHYRKKLSNNQDTLHIF